MRWTVRLRSLTRSPITIRKQNSDENSCDMGRLVPFRTAIITHDKRGADRESDPLAL